MNDVEYLQKEIAETNAQMIHGIYLLVTLMTSAFIVGIVTDKTVLYKLVFVLAISITFWIARNDYLIHRAGAHIASVEVVTEVSGWETAKSHLKSRYLMFALDIMASLGFLWMLYRSWLALTAAGEHGFALLSVIGVIAGIVTSVVMVKLADIRW